MTARGSNPSEPPKRGAAKAPAAATARPGDSKQAAARPSPAEDRKAPTPAKPAASGKPEIKTAAVAPAAGPAAKPAPAARTRPEAAPAEPPPPPPPPEQLHPAPAAPEADADLEEEDDQPEPPPPPRPPAKAEKFAEGDHVVYPTHGVGKVDRIATEEIAGHKLELIHITFEENRMTLRVPVAKARSAGLRKLATRKLFDEALTVLKGRARVKRTMWSRRAQEYEAKINSGDPLAIAEVVRDLHRNAGQPDQSFSERQIYEAAMDRLAAELAALDQTDKVTAATKLVDFLKTV
ncbi:MAG: CarD family transcriptional regulator [Acetobacteraceae bacterium]|nr:CarD family transcriptional regulator [Acetobacteraceae bacterium]